jgi:hypothetical protein
MIESDSTVKREAGWVWLWVTALLALTATVYLGFRLVLALGLEDTDRYESPLMLSVARQLVATPWELYGPFGGQNPLVLIHAPLYYRLAALVAWALAGTGLDPISAARLGGRSISVLSFLATLAASYRLARLDRASPRAGWWAVLLIVVTPALAAQPIAVRPDMLGVAFQTAGVLLVLSVLQAHRPGWVRLCAGFTAFALAFCVKQHLVVAAMLSTGLVSRAGRQGRLSGKTIERGLLPGLGIVLLVFGLEELVTWGRMGQAVWVAAGHVGQVHPADWLHVATVALALIGKSTGLIALLAAAGLAAVGTQSGLGRGVFVTGSVLLGLTVVLLGLQCVLVRPWITWPLVAVLLGILALVIPACLLMERPLKPGERLDHLLWAYCIAELAVVLVLSRATSGAWINYAIQAVVFACILTARALARGCEAPRRLGTLLPVALAAVVVPVSVLMEVKEVTSQRLAERAALAQILTQIGQPPPAYFFVDRPGLNRVHGQLELVFDDWLYPVFESLGLAEPRKRWLRQALTSGPVRVVLTGSQSPGLDGIPESLPRLGYASVGPVGPFWMWTR